MINAKNFMIIQAPCSKEFHGNNSLETIPWKQFPGNNSLETIPWKEFPGNKFSGKNSREEIP